MYARASQRQSARKLRVVVTGGLGDCLLVTPFIRHFREELAYQRIECWCHESVRNLFENNPRIDRVVAFQGDNLRLGALPERDWDVFAPYLELSTESPEGIRLQRGRNQVDLPLVTQIGNENGLCLSDTRMEIFPNSEDLHWAADLARSFGPLPVVLLNGLSRLPVKDLPATMLAEIRAGLSDMAQVLVMDRCAEASHSGRIHRIPFPTLRQSAALYAHLAAVVTVDSFPAHLAAATGVPAVVLYGPSNPACWKHPGQLALRPTRCPVCADTVRLRECITPACMREYSSGGVIDMTRALLAGTKPDSSTYD